MWIYKTDLGIFHFSISSHNSLSTKCKIDFKRILFAVNLAEAHLLCKEHWQQDLAS